MSNTKSETMSSTKSETKIVSLTKFLERKARQDNCDYDYTVTPEGKRDYS